jgi:hypothetical protein
MFAGLGVICGPILSTLIMARWGARYCFAVSVGVSTLCVVHLLSGFKETLPPSDRTPMNWFQAQPLSFLQIISASRPLAVLMAVTGLQTLSEGRNTTDVASIYMREDLGWGWSKVNRFISSLGVGLVVSGASVRKSLSTFGLRGHTTLSNVSNAAQWAVWGMPSLFGLDPSSAMYLGLLFTIPGARKRDAVESLVNQLATEKGFGKGMISGSLMNFRAILNVLGPYMFGKAYVSTPQPSTPLQPAERAS